MAQDLLKTRTKDESTTAWRSVPGAKRRVDERKAPRRKGDLPTGEITRTNTNFLLTTINQKKMACPAIYCRTGHFLEKNLTTGC
jgi:hypothetical protein